MTDIRSFLKALKIFWIKKVWVVNYQADWKRLLLCDHLYWEDVWLLNKKSLSVLPSSFVVNTLWRNVVESWAEYVREPAQASDVLSQPLWNNVFIRIENKPVFYRSWYVKNLRYVNDLVDESDLLMSPTELINKFNLKGTFYKLLVLCAQFQIHGNQRLEILVKGYPRSNLKIWRDYLKQKERPVSLMIPCVNQFPHS